MCLDSKHPSFRVQFGVCVCERDLKQSSVLTFSPHIKRAESVSFHQRPVVCSTVQIPGGGGGGSPFGSENRRTVPALS